MYQSRVKDGVYIVSEVGLFMRPEDSNGVCLLNRVYSHKNDVIMNFTPCDGWYNTKQLNIARVR